MATRRRAVVETVDALIGRNLHEHREGRGASQEAFGEAVGDLLGRRWPKQTVSKIEKGRRPLTVTELLAVALTLEVPVTALLTAHPASRPELELKLSDEYAITLGELREAVTGDPADQHAAAVEEARQVLIAELHERSVSIATRSRVRVGFEVVDVKSGKVKQRGKKR